MITCVSTFWISDAEYLYRDRHSDRKMHENSAPTTNAPPMNISTLLCANPIVDMSESASGSVFSARVLTNKRVHSTRSVVIMLQFAFAVVLSLYVLAQRLLK